MLQLPKAILSCAAILVAGAFSPGCRPSAEPTSAKPNVAKVAGHVRLYALDCGRIEIADYGFFTDAGKPIGQARTLVDPCFLVRHPKGTLLWDTGLRESIADQKQGNPNPVGREFIDGPSLREQLGVLSLRPSDITFVGLSHLHADHSGNANLFVRSTWLVNGAELRNALATPPPIGVDPTTFSEYTNATIERLDADRDVFGDGTVRILQTPGHTPGHQSLALQLEGAGMIVLAGDLCHSRDNWDKHVVPAFNDSRDRTLLSMGRVEQLVAEHHARLVVQHAPEDFHALPKFPAYLE